ncbi:MAG: YjbH domain-containing protein, partial [Rubellimicrobium sp.]|nr:YjbH domain-containing protein [Rubellimicrobium sp.]
MRVRCQNRLCSQVSGLLLGSLVLTGAAPALAQDWTFSYDMFGGPGMIDMPVATSPAGGTLALNAANFRNTTRYSLTFQVNDRLSAGFRYSLNDNFNLSDDPDNPRVVNFLFDRSFGLHYRLANETQIRPAIAVGVNDFLGTGRFAAEYLVATKTFGDFRATVGLGWGRLAGVGGFDNPLGIFDDRFNERPVRSTVGLGGQIDTSRWFRGDAAVFG